MLADSERNRSKGIHQCRLPEPVRAGLVDPTVDYLIDALAANVQIPGNRLSGFFVLIPLDDEGITGTIHGRDIDLLDFRVQRRISCDAYEVQTKPSV